MTTDDSEHYFYLFNIFIIYFSTILALFILWFFKSYLSECASIMLYQVKCFQPKYRTKKNMLSVLTEILLRIRTNQNIWSYLLSVVGICRSLSRHTEGRKYTLLAHCRSRTQTHLPFTLGVHFFEVNSLKWSSDVTLYVTSGDVWNEKAFPSHFCDTPPYWRI